MSHSKSGYSNGLMKLRSYLGRKFEPFDELIYNVIHQYDLSIRKELFNNIILSGGSTLIPEF